MLRDPRHSACRRMLEDVTRERDEAVIERDHWQRMYEELKGRFDTDMNRYIEASEAFRAEFSRLMAETKAENEGLRVELAMVREGLTP